MEIKLYYNKPEVLSLEPRKRKFITLASSLKEYLEYLYDELNVEDYSFSYLIEDMIYWLTSNKEALRKFILDTYDLEGEELIITPPPKEVIDFVEKLAERLTPQEENKEVE